MSHSLETAIEEFAIISVIERVSRTIKNIKEVADIVDISDDVIEDFDKEFNNLVNADVSVEEWFKKARDLETRLKGVSTMAKMTQVLPS